MAKVVFERKMSSLFRKVNISVEQHSFELKRGENKVVELPQKEYDVIVELDERRRSLFKLDLNDDKRIIIRRRLPEWYYWIVFVGSVCFLLFSVKPAVAKIFLSIVVITCLYENFAKNPFRINCENA